LGGAASAASGPLTHPSAPHNAASERRTHSRKDALNEDQKSLSHRVQTTLARLAISPPQVYPADMSTPRFAAVHSDPEIMSGTVVFAGTRVPFQTLIDYIEAGQPLSEFLEDFPTVSSEQAIAALEQAKEALLTVARPA
jgi:uncharacterized protein (DUF433 family)